VTGNVTATEKVDLQATGVVDGDITAPRLTGQRRSRTEDKDPPRLLALVVAVEEVVARDSNVREHRA
jgi:hypothetical protein